LSNKHVAPGTLGKKARGKVELVPNKKGGEVVRQTYAFKLIVGEEFQKGKKGGGSSLKKKTWRWVAEKFTSFGQRDDKRMTKGNPWGRRKRGKRSKPEGLPTSGRGQRKKKKKE